MLMLDRQRTIKKSHMVGHVFHGYYKVFEYHIIIYPINIYTMLTRTLMLNLFLRDIEPCLL